MDETQHFCLRWNNYQSSITSAFENLRDDEDFVDVTLACEGRSIKAHRVVLSACSPYFRDLLKVRFAMLYYLSILSPSLPIIVLSPKCGHNIFSNLLLCQLRVVNVYEIL